MSSPEDAFFQSLRATFTIEAAEHLQAITTGLLELEKTPAQDKRHRIVETIFRAAHSLKGAARTVNFTEIESICQTMEDAFSAWKRQESVPSGPVLDLLHRALDTMANVIRTPKGQRVAGGTSSLLSLTQALRQLGPSSPFLPLSESKGVETGLAEAVSFSGPAAGEKAPMEETVRIAVAKLDTQLLEAEEMLAVKLTVSQRAVDLRELEDQFGEWEKEWVKVQPEVRAFRQTFDSQRLAQGAVSAPFRWSRLDEFLDWNHDYLKSLENKVAALSRMTEQDRLFTGKLVDDLLEDSKKLLMLPLATLTIPFPKLVRDLCHDQGKEADLVIRGEEVEIDKRILEEMKDPLIHLLRNCMDHGIETPEQRLRMGKPSRATITLAVSALDNNKVELLVSDDGGGIDPDKVKKSAIQHGVISEEEARQCSEPEVLELIFQSDVSTSPIITQLSGRGLGLAIVREKTQKLDGNVSVESRQHVGTTIRIILPIALATCRGLLLEAAERLFVVPTTQVERVTPFKIEDIQTVEGCETLSLGGRTIALVRLADVLELPSTKRPGDLSAAMLALVLGTGDQSVAFEVAAVRDELEVLVRRLGAPLSRVRNITGATILGSGQVVPILNVADLLKSARRPGRGGGRVIATEKPVKAKTKSILVVEDSITSRLLLKGILESVGYRVKTAVDGVGAFTALREEPFDLIVSDVEMPRMNGFDLTAKIRAHKKLAELPVVLVTALETREDRERGIEVGANAYIVKSSFDQSNLLAAIQRLL